MLFELYLLSTILLSSLTETARKVTGTRHSPLRTVQFSSGSHAESPRTRLPDVLALGAEHLDEVGDGVLSLGCAETVACEE